MDFRDFFDRYVMLGFERQLHLASTIADRPWHADLDAGLIAIEGLGSFRIQVIGSESGQGGSWLWSWANEASGLPGAVTDRVATLPALTGEMPEFARAELPLSERVDGHRLSVLTPYLLDFQGYCRAPNGPGAAFLGIDDRSFPRDPRPAMQRFVTTVPQVLSTFQVTDHRSMVEGYARVRGFAITGTPDRLELSGDGGTATVHFDGPGRISGVEGTLAPDGAERRSTPAAPPSAGLIGRIFDRGR